MATRFWITTGYGALLAALCLSAPAQRLIVTADNGTTSGMLVRGYDPCTGLPDGLAISGGAGGLTSPRSARSGPNGNLFVVSLSHGIIYEIFRRPTGGNNN